MTEEEKKMKAKKLADALRNGDMSVCEDCLDFISYAHDDRMEVLEALAAKKNGKKEKEEVEEIKEVKEPKAEDGCAKAKDKGEEVVETVEEAVAEPVVEDGCCGKKGGKAKDEIPPPPPPEPAPEKKEEAPAAAAAPAAEPPPPPAPAPAPAPEPAKAPVAAEPTKDCGLATVTEPSISAPVAKTEADKDDDKPKEPKAEDGKNEPCKDGLCNKDKTKTCDCGGKEPAAVDGGITKEPLGGAFKPMPEKEETFGEGRTAMDGVDPETFAKVAAECDRARKLALAVGQMGIAIDSAGKREIEVAREAVKQIPSLAFAVDAADEQVLMAVRGAIAARADELARARNRVVTLLDTPAVAQDASPKAAVPADLDKAFAAYFK